MTDPGREKEGGRVVLLLLLVLAVLAGGGYAAAYAGAGEKVPRGTTVAGVEIGGMTRDRAVETLEEGLAQRADAPLEVTADGRTRRVSPAEAGLSVDHVASVEAAGGGRSWAPERLWNYYTGGEELPAVVEVDSEKMDALLEELDDELGRPARNGAVDFRGTRLRVTDPRPGETVDADAASTALADAYLADDAAPVDLELVPLEPEIDSAEVRRAVSEFANPALSAPVTLRFGKADVRLLPRDYAGLLRLRPVDGTLRPAVETKAFKRLIGSRVSGSGAPVDATFRIIDGVPEVVPSRPGVKFRAPDVAEALLRVVARPDGKRSVQVASKAARPDFTTAEARALGITEEVSSFTTYYPHAEYRNVNLGRAAELIDGTVLEPGETFSLNGTVGERTRANGFVAGTIISDGVYKEELGGSVSQMATTLFNAMFFAGLEDVEHRPHSFYIDRYPVGREATVVWGALDLKFRNDTRHGVLLDVQVTPSTPSSPGEVTVTMYSTDVWDITTSESERYAYTDPETRRISGDECIPHEGYGGFDIDVKRYFRRAESDELVRTENFHTTYLPSDTVVCTGPDGEDG